jgi:hypothetical protein
MPSVEELASACGRMEDMGWFAMRLLLLRSRLGAGVTGPALVRDVRSFAVEFESFVSELVSD